jgi:predicted Zn-dependent peptidase
VTLEGIERTELPSGLRVITERMHGVRSVSLGVWAGVGSRDEAPGEAGASHYLEHLLFKGTARRTATEIAEAMDAIGAEHNAFTAKEHTCYYARTLDRDLPLATDVLADMVLASKMDQADVDAERTVILEEIGMHADAPDDVVVDLFATTLFGDHPLGRPVLGTVDSIQAMTRDQLHAYWRRHYQPSDLVVAAAGNVTHEQVVELVSAAFSAAGEPGGGGSVRGRTAPTLASGVRVQRKDTEQAHLVFGGRGIARDDPRRFALDVFNVAFGGGMSSRLFQEVRERRGLVYSISSYSIRHDETGSFSVYAGTAPKRVEEVLSIVRDEIGTVLADGLTAAEIERSKGHLKGSLALGMEDSASRMMRLGKAEVSAAELLDTDEIVERIEAVDADAIQAVAKEVLGGGPRALAAVGPLDEASLEPFVG